MQVKGHVATARHSLLCGRTVGRLGRVTTVLRLRLRVLLLIFFGFFALVFIAVVVIIGPCRTSAPLRSQVDAVVVQFPAGRVVRHVPSVVALQALLFNIQVHAPCFSLFTRPTHLRGFQGRVALAHAKVGAVSLAVATSRVVADDHVNLVLLAPPRAGTCPAGRLPDPGHSARVQGGYRQVGARSPRPGSDGRTPTAGHV